MEAKILWVDDEVELLKPHILFLENKGYSLDKCNNGYDALEMIASTPYDLIILDEMMPGITGLETLQRIKDIRPDTPVVMVTKSEEEDIMNRAIGSKIADYIIKPVNPNQVLLSIKKNVHSQQIVTEHNTADYRSQFQQISMSFSEAKTFEDWINIYKKIVNWELELESSSDKGISEVLTYQKTEANNEFAKFVKKNYLEWFKEKSFSRPILSHTLMRNRVFSTVDKSSKTTFLLIDNFRYDQWLTIRSLVSNFFNTESEDFYCSILPTATQYARNAIFAGLTPLAIEKIMPGLWLNDNEEGGKNMYEEDFLRRQLKSLGKNYKLTFDKLVRTEHSKRLLENFSKVYNADLSVIIYNFLDILSHARTDTDIIRELAEDESAFRSLTRSWFEHSDLWAMLKLLSEKGHTVIITSDHGTVQVTNPIKVVGDKETSVNLRYKLGKSLNYKAKDVFEITQPELAGLPKSNISSRYVFAANNDFLCYPNNYNHYVRYYKNTFQHGGISMEEMIVPYITLTPKRK